MARGKKNHGNKEERFHVEEVRAMRSIVEALPQGGIGSRFQGGVRFGHNEVDVEDHKEEHDDIARGA